MTWLPPVALGAPDEAADEAEDEIDDADENPYRPGVIAQFSGPDGKPHTRLNEQIALTADDDPPDERLAPGPFAAVLKALVLVQAPGVHRLRVFASGHVRVTWAGELVLDAHAREPKWLDTEPVDLPFGFHALEVRYRRDDEPVRLALFWEGPGFALEPLAARWLFHNTGSTPAGTFVEGRRLARGLRCAACHDVPGQADSLAAPALNRLAGNLSRAWIVERLTGKAREPDYGAAEKQPWRGMPHFALDPDDAEAVADYLLSASEKVEQPAVTDVAERPVPARKKTSKQAPENEPELPSVAAGATLFRSIGCLACHRVGELGTDGPFAGGDLSAISVKRPAGFFARWLVDPASIDPDHRMPVFAISALERASLSLYLGGLGARRETAPESIDSPDNTRVARGAELVSALRCAACHRLPQSHEAVPRRIPLALAALDEEAGGCLGEPNGSRPGYRLEKAARRNLAEYLSSRAQSPAAAALNGRDVLVERNCLSCHARGHAPGLGPHLQDVAEAEENLRDALPLLRPPSLVGVGDKLRDESLAAAIRVSAKPRQSWLRVRMPRFPLSDEETAALVRHLVDVDRIPERPDAPPAALTADSAAEIEAAGARLVTADGFGCTSCHAIGRWTPQKVAPGAEGADLSQIGRRVRREWFDRWVRNPVRIVPEMEMPSIVQPVRGVLEEHLDRQIAALWNVLEREDFTPPVPNALRIVRRANMPGVDEQAAVLTDVIEVGGVALVKPLVIGMPNRHNVLYDLATGRLAAWWTGDVARQQTRGKTWYWEAGMPQLLPPLDDRSASKACELALVVDGERYEAVPRGQYVTEFDTFEHVLGGIVFKHRLSYSLPGRPATLHVAQQFVAATGGHPGGMTGFRRQMKIDALPRGTAIELVILPGEVTIDASGRMASGGAAGAHLDVLLRSPEGARLANSDRGAIVQLPSIEETSVSLDLEYRADLVVDQFPPLPVVDRSVEQVELAVVPGFAATRLPVTDECMPTGLAWQPDGTLVVSSLEGRVWLGRDTDGDGLEDRLAPFSDDLAAPYGVAAHGEAIDAINKYGLVRLFDRDGDGSAEQTSLIASGWGHTRDYHDWAIGLPRDDEGNYYVSLPCQQDDRSEAAAALRGKIVRLVPRTSSGDDPRLYSIEVICGGLRFGQGLARSAEGELFVTDNQGNYNPFNELNHVVAGARYGFINRLEAKAGMKPGDHQTPAIKIPHPWTRSVNGICFLTLPAGGRAADDARSAGPFGPLTGQLVGCEYDTRRLVRMSLERVGGEFQGAVYPLSREPVADEPTFEGPVVCQVSPDGDLYVGNLRDSGWGAGSNTGSIVRLRWRGDLPPGIAAVRARPGGFAIDFAAPVERSRAADAANYSISSYRRISTPAYGGEDVDRRVESIEQVTISDDRLHATIDLPKLRTGFVYEFHLRDLATGGLFFPAEAYYTLNKVVGDH